MKKKIIIIISAILVVAVLAVLFVFFKNDISKKDDNTEKKQEVVEMQDFLSLSTKSEIEKYAEIEDVEIEKEDRIYNLYEVETKLGTASVRVLSDEYDVSRIFFNFNLFTPDYSELGESTVYNPTKADKEKGEKAFKELKKSFENYLECGELTNYSIVQSREVMDGEVVPESEDERFYQGFIVKEYSVRDKDGTLWILTYASVNGTSWAEIIKVVEETGYEGFIPNIDMTR